MARPRTPQHLRENGPWIQGELIHNVSTPVSTGSHRRGPKPIHAELDAVAARLFDAGAREYPDKALLLASGLSVAPQTVSAWRVGERGVPGRAFAKLTCHQSSARALILAIAREATLRVRFIDDPTEEQLDRKKKKNDLAELLIELAGALRDDINEVK